MAQRRMLSRSVIESDSFCAMPPEAQLLYQRLNMAADDDGFVANLRTILRAYGLAAEAMEPLLERGFVIGMENAGETLYLIRHWRMHNYIQRDRYKPGPYRLLLERLEEDENRVWKLPDALWTQSAPAVDTQVRSGQESGREGEGTESVRTAKEKENTLFSPKENPKESASKHFSTSFSTSCSTGGPADGPPGRGERGGGEGGG